MKEHFVTTQDNEKIAFNLYSKTESDSDSVLVICPGWFMTKDTKQFREIAREFVKYIDVVCLDFRGHGRSSGGYTFSAREVVDLSAVIEYLKPSYKKVNLLGFSLGGTISIQYCSMNADVSKLITVSAPADFNKVENHMWSPNAFIPTIKKWIDNENDKTHKRNIRINNPFLKKIKACEVISSVEIPHLVLGGEKDPTVSPGHAQRLYENSGDNARLKIYSGCFHAEDLFYQANEEFMKDCLEFLNL